MAKKHQGRISMQHIKEIIRLNNLGGQSNRTIATSCKVSPTTVGEYIGKYKESGISYEHFIELDDDSIRQIFLPSQPEKPHKKPMPDMDYLHKELSRKHVTMQLLWEEYIAEHQDGYSRSQFSYIYQQWRKQLDPVMHMSHKAGEKVFVDFSGSRPSITDPLTGEITEVELFVGTLGASSYTYAVCVYSQQLENWILCHTKMFEYFGGVPECIVPDNLKSGVTDACFYDPEINRTYADLAAHYNSFVLPARPRHPKDKGKVENGVKIAQNRILASIRDKVFYSLQELNAAISEELEKLNDRQMAHINRSRRQLFEELDKPALKALPPEQFEMFAWKRCKVHVNYHIAVDKINYSVPYTLIGKSVDVRYNSRLLEIFYNGKRVVSHIRSYNTACYVTIPSHMPSNHNILHAWSPEKISRWAEGIGEYTGIFVDTLISNSRHPEQSIKSCMGIKALSRKYPQERLEAACKRALDAGAVRYKHLKSILETGMDKISYIEPETTIIPIHENIRGGGYYHIGGE